MFLPTPYVKFAGDPQAESEHQPGNHAGIRLSAKWSHSRARQGTVTPVASLIRRTKAIGESVPRSRCRTTQTLYFPSVRCGTHRAGATAAPPSSRNPGCSTATWSVPAA